MGMKYLTTLLIAIVAYTHGDEVRAQPEFVVQDSLELKSDTTGLVQAYLNARLYTGYALSAQSDSQYMLTPYVCGVVSGSYIELTSNGYILSVMDVAAGSVENGWSMELDSTGSKVSWDFYVNGAIIPTTDTPRFFLSTGSTDSLQMNLVVEDDGRMSLVLRNDCHFTVFVPRTIESRTQGSDVGFQVITYHRFRRKDRLVDLVPLKPSGTYRYELSPQVLSIMTVDLQYLPNNTSGHSRLDHLNPDGSLLVNETEFDGASSTAKFSFPAAPAGVPGP